MDVELFHFMLSAMLVLSIDCLCDGLECMAWNRVIYFSILIWSSCVKLSELFRNTTKASIFGTVLFVVNFCFRMPAISLHFACSSECYVAITLRHALHRCIVCGYIDFGRKYIYV